MITHEIVHFVTRRYDKIIQSRVGDVGLSIIILGGGVKRRYSKNPHI